jgi:hypothetical protein
LLGIEIDAVGVVVPRGTCLEPGEPHRSTAMHFIDTNDSKLADNISTGNDVRSAL